MKYSQSSACWKDRQKRWKSPTTTGIKCWQGKDGKITHEELKRLCQMSGIEFNSPRSNQEERDSALLAITCSGLPIKYKVVESNFNK